MALSADRDVKFYASQELIELPVDDNVRIYKGAFVGRNRSTGYVRPLTAGDDFVGVAYQPADNTISGHTAGGIRVRLHQMVDIVHALSGVVLADVGKEVYASADDTLTLDSDGHSRIGRIVAVESTGVARVRCRPVSGCVGVLEGMPFVTLADESATLTLDHLNRTLVMANTEARTLVLPSASSARAGAWLRLVKTSAVAAAVVLEGHTVEKVNGSSTYSDVDAQYDSVLIMCTGTGWVVLSRDVA